MKTNEERPLTWLEEAMQIHPRQVFELDADDPTQLIIRPERNKRPTPPVGDKSLSELVKSMEDLGIDGQPAQLQPCRATLNEDGVADLYMGFRRARAVQTHNAGLPADSPDRWLLHVVIDERPLAESEVTLRTIAENAFRKDLTPLQKTEVINDLLADNYTLRDISEKIGMSIGAVSTYAKFSLLPANAKKLLAADKMGYSAAEDFVKMLPARAELAADEDGSVLKAAQDKIAKQVDKATNKTSGKVTANSADAATRKAADETGKAPVNQTQRKTKAILSEIAAQVEKSGADAPETAKLNAIAKFVNGGSMKALIKALVA